MDIRLQKFLAESGIASRRHAETLIAEGRVCVNGNIVTVLGTTIDPARDTVAFDGKTVTWVASYIYLMLNKPEGVVTSVTDPQNRPVVMDYIRDIPARVYPVGRLDANTSGLLLLTNDGTLAYSLTHPKYSVPKTYTARLSGIPDQKALHDFRSGIIIDHMRTAPADIKVIKSINTGNCCEAQITIREGRNRQIRKMCETIGHPVLRLKRVAVGNLHLGDLRKGSYRHLSEIEINDLYSLFNKKIFC